MPIHPEPGPHVGVSENVAVVAFSDPLSTMNDAYQTLQIARRLRTETEHLSAHLDDLIEQRRKLTRLLAELDQVDARAMQQAIDQMTSETTNP